MALKAHAPRADSHAVRLFLRDRVFPTVVLVGAGALAPGVGLHVLVGGPVAADLYRAAQSRPLHGDLRAAALVSAEEAFLGARVRSLMVRLARKDCSTEEHTRRVALLAVQMGEELGLAPGRLRQLAIGGLLHDIGKLGVPT